MLKIFVLVLLTAVYAYESNCNQDSVLIKIRRPTYEYSVGILDRVAHVTSAHFIFSPLSTWLQLLALAEGAQGETLNEILNVTKYHRIQCFRKKVRELFNYLDEEINVIAKRRSVIVIDRLLDVKDSYVNEIEKLNAAKVISANFKTNVESAAIANEIIDVDSNDFIAEGIDPQDFNMAVLLMSDVANLKADWRSPFYPIYTKPEVFYTDEKIANGYVNMMQRIGYYNVTNIPKINAKALELPFNNRLTMILLLPNKGRAGDLFWMLRDIRLMTIFRLFERNGQKLVNLRLPRFKQTTNIDNIPELLYDMGVHRIFYYHLANLKRMSDYKAFVSLMTNEANIEVTEQGVSGNVASDLIIDSKRHLEFTLNRPFAYLIVDRTTELILFAGIYRNPSKY